GLAFHNYYDTFREFPVTAYNPNMDANGRAKLGWRVYLLPYLGYSNLFNQFHLDEAWDSPHNLTLLDKMPEIYRSRGIPVRSHLTGFQLLTGPDAYLYRVGDYGSAHGPSLNYLLDGLESTILTLETLPSQAVEWTRPDGDILFDLAHPLDNIDFTGLENVPADGLLTLMVDGSIRSMKPNISPEDFAALATWQQGEVIDASQKDRVYYDFGGSFSPELNQFSHGSTALRNIGLALHNYYDVFLQFPINNWPNYFDAEGKPKLSWRVHLLPWLGELNLYNQFHLDEPWDSPHNLPLLDKMPEIFLSRGLTGGTNLTGFQVVWSPESYYSSPNNRPTFGRITDGDDLTIGVIETPPELAVSWTKPEDFPFNPADPFSEIRALVSDYIAVMFMSASVRAVNPQIAPADAAAMITWRGGEISN
ncbi:MAG: DUF1559 domain-containing protein, partial [Planctomycetaceae bacterium]|nr:DUF1559 domain-containing protein [Planctomycetaceae bacterium]